MELIRVIKGLFCRPRQTVQYSPFELDLLLDKQLEQGKVFGALATLKKLGRPFGDQERVALIKGCLATKSYAEAFYLTRALSIDSERQGFLQTIAREAAQAEDFSTARAAALFLERGQS